ncbi:hypothetical protein [Dysgonomonas sp. 511]|uniref:hypothetical protein n=1 Tax=Dysgonomonas sp. 511 TaxID=2302930 RepID=UPI0013D4FEEE|nr:hypothetical protein [Dysgonomonas sp. 511]NDV79128.1 hypothetical protein [Dysgonomonas sp. 511]
MLNDIDKNKNPFKVPENYFRDFNLEIMDKLPAKEERRKVVPLWKKLAPWTAVAAAFIGVLFLTGVFDATSTTSPDIAAAQPDSVISQGMAYSDDEEYYYAFLEEEVTRARYKDLLYSSN